MTGIDHVVLASADVQGTATRLRNEHGLDCVSPATFGELGLANLIAPMADGSYLEVLAVADLETAELTT